MKKVLQVVSCLELGGTEAFIMNNYRALDKTKVQFDFLVFIEKDYPYIQEIQQMGGRVFFCGVPSIKRLSVFLKNVKHIAQEYGPYDAIHSHVNIANAWVLWAAKKVKIPVRISHSHDTSGKENKKVYRKFQEYLIKKNATVYLACSKDAGVYLYGEKFFQKNGRTIKNGIGVGKFIASHNNPTILKRESKIDEREIVFGNITRFEPKKNQMFILDIFQEVIKRQPNALLILGGPDGGQLEVVKQRAKILGVDDKVRFIGQRKDIAECLKLIDVYLFPSLYEGLGIALLEAQASGCLCFASNGVSREADMGIGTVHFMDLQQSPDVWAAKILHEYDRYLRPTDEEIKNAFAKSGYDIAVSSQELMNIYEGK